MPLLGPAGMLLSFDVESDAVAEHDHWHTHEHLAERLSIPGFIRASRWVALRGQPRYMVLYEVAGLDTLTSAPYLQRLNDPSAWTTRIMPSYRGMSRGLCTVTASFGLGLGGVCLLIRLEPGASAEASLQAHLVDDVLPQLTARPGIGSAHLLQGAAAAPMTHEQRMRGADVAVDWALLVTGYEEDALAGLADGALGAAELMRRGGGDATHALYGLRYVASRAELPTA